MPLPDWKTLIGYKGVEELVLDAFVALAAKGSAITNLNKGGVFRTVTELSMQGVEKLWELVATVAPQGFVVSATGAWLDAHAEGLGTARELATATEGTVRWTKTQAGGVVNVPGGQVVATLPTAQGQVYRFGVIATTPIPDGTLELDIPMRALTPGSAYNVAPNTLTVLEVPLAGIASVNNPASDWLTLEGTDDELDGAAGTQDALRGRLMLRWNELARGSTRKAYEAWALEVAGVVSVKVLDEFPRGPGTVDVVIMGPEGAPTAQLVAAVQAYIEVRKPNTADVLVRGPDEVVIDGDVAAYYDADIVTDPAAFTAAITARWNALFLPDADLDTKQFGIGGDFIVVKAVAELMRETGLVNLKLWDPALGEPTPADDVVIAGDALAVLGNFALSVQPAVSQ